MFALVDCNNFYVSCERLFRPDLQHKPVIVLSNNDGCVVSRSNEAKALCIAMGSPFFKVRHLCKQHKIEVFSSNYTLYGDISYRVMRTIADYWSDVEYYSIDEAFLDLTTLPASSHTDFCTQLQKTILKHTGVPTSIGIGKTKTLAKIANANAKKRVKTPVFNLSGQEHFLQLFPIEDVWGIGRHWGKQLQAFGITTAASLAATNPHWLKNRFNVILMRTAMELSGIACGGLEEETPKQSIIASKSFGSLQTDFNVLAQALSNHCYRAFEKLRAQETLTQQVSVFIQSNRFRKDLPAYNNAASYSLIYPSDDLRHLIKIATHCLKKIYKPGIHYQKIGVRFLELTPRQPMQHDLFVSIDESNLEKTERLMQLFDTINGRFGPNGLKLAAQGVKQPWAMKQEKKSPHYTTCWEQLLKVRA